MSTVKNQYHVLRLHEGTDPKEDWHSIGARGYEDTEIDLIKDPSKGSKKEITSIPSPFARIHLFEDAFKIIASQANNDRSALDGESVYHKLVSDALDMAQILFNYDLINARQDIDLEIVKWNKDLGIKNLKESHLEAHRLLGETLELFIKQDGDQSKLSKVHHLYFLKYNNKVIGGTSPSSLFFTSANDLSHVDIKIADDRFFDNDFFPLYKRSYPFQEYLHLLFKVYPSLKGEMESVWSYLDVNLKRLEKFKPEEAKKLHAKIKSYSLEQFKKDYDEDGVIEVLPDLHHRKKRAGSVAGGTSDFAIASSKFEGDKLPLVLESKFGKQLNYIDGLWDTNTEVPPYDPEPNLEKRVLPGQSYQYPYLTISDFLEKTLVKLAFPIDKENFFDGNPEGFYEGDEDTLDPPEDSYLLPIKKDYFKYFNTEDLMTTAPDRKPAFKMVKVGTDCVRVELRIPIKKNGECIKFERLYRTNANPDVEKNEGNIEEHKVSLGFFPFVKDSNNTELRVGLVDGGLADEHRLKDYDLDFYNNNSSGNITVAQETTRSDKHKHNHNGTTKYYVLEDEFDFLMIKENQVRGMVIPKFRFPKSGNKRFTFAIDFGTTNTHIEYAIENENPRAFDITKGDAQVITLFDKVWESTLPDPALRDLLERELVPRELGTEESAYNFPLRTAVSEIDGLQHSASTFALGDINIPFIYEKKQYLDNSIITTNLKWVKLSDTDGEKNNNRVQSFLETLLILIRNKVLLNGGSLDKTEVIWFYPSSMSRNQVNRYTRIWNKLFERHIAPKKGRTTIQYSESEVPFYCYGSNEVKSARYPVVNVDIGGGTTDIVVFERNQPIFLTSIKFAGNAVFGDAYEDGIAINNGFVRAFKPKVQRFLSENNSQLYQLERAYAQLESSQKFSSSDLIAFFFSIEKNKDVRDNRLDFSFTELMADDDEFKIVFIVFYGAIIYHIASLMKTLELKMPRNICLSGNGSKIINLLDSNPKLGTVEQFSKKIIQKVYGVSSYHNGDLKMVQGSEPKEATCKGGIRKFRQGGAANPFDSIVLFGGKLPKRDENGDIMKDSDDKPIMEYIYINEEETNFEKASLRYEKIQDPGHPEYKQAVEKEVLEFIDFLFELHKDFNFSTNFGVNSGDMKWYKDILTRDIGSSLETGLEWRLQLTDESENIAETLFFYPLVASLYELAEKIAEKRI